MTDTFDFDAYLALPRLSGLRLSPDGSRLVVTVSRPAKDGNKMRSSIWEVDPSGDRRPTRLTRSAPGESVGAFLRDGSLLFTSSRPDADAAADDDENDETSRLWRLAPSGGEAHILVSAAGGIEDVVTARDADVLAFSAGVFPGTTSLAADKEKQQARKKAGVEALLFESYPIRRWDHYLGPRDRHLFAAAAVEGEERIDCSDGPHAGRRERAPRNRLFADAGRRDHRHGVAGHERPHQPARAAGGDRSRERSSPHAHPGGRLLVPRPGLFARRSLGRRRTRHVERAGRAR